MKIAICLYGQPRNYIVGYNNIKKIFFGYNIEFFFHCWTINNLETYDVAPWRNINKENLIVNDQEKINSDLINLYKPVKYMFEKSINKFDENIYLNTIAYENSNSNNKSNINNVLSQIYSRNRVCDIFNNYVTNNNLTYDFVVICRFDINNCFKLNFYGLNKDNVYVSNIHSPRKIIDDNFIISPQLIFVKWFKIFDNLKNILSNYELKNKIELVGEKLIINAEELVLANYLFYFDLKNIIYLSNIPNILV
jgi:hypothetical protein